MEPERRAGRGEVDRCAARTVGSGAESGTVSSTTLHVVLARVSGGAALRHVLMAGVLIDSAPLNFTLGCAWATAALADAADGAGGRPRR